MSTKIYTGFRFPAMSCNMLQNAIRNLRKDIQEAVVVLVNAYVIEESVRLSDRVRVGEAVLEPGTSPFGHTTQALMRNLFDARNMPGQADWQCDFSVSLVLFPLRNHTLGMYFSRQDHAFLPLIKQGIPGFEEYAYFNNTDRPEELNARQWLKRKRDWDAALPGVGIPTECGFLVDLNTHDGTAAAMWAHARQGVDVTCQPTFERRLRACAYDIAGREVMRDGEVGGSAFSAMRYLDDSPQGQAKLQAVKDRIAPLLPQVYSLDALKEKVGSS